MRLIDFWQKNKFYFLLNFSWEKAMKKVLKRKGIVIHLLLLMEDPYQLI
jgi:hypothetical protein